MLVRTLSKTGHLPSTTKPQLPVIWEDQNCLTEEDVLWHKRACWLAKEDLVARAGDSAEMVEKGPSLWREGNSIIGEQDEIVSAPIRIWPPDLLTDTASFKKPSDSMKVENLEVWYNLRRI